MFEVARCRSCQAKIIWGRTEAKEGKPSRPIPIDADPDNHGEPMIIAGGNLIIAANQGGTPVVRYVPTAIGKHVAHFASCPNAAKHRKKK